MYWSPAREFHSPSTGHSTTFSVFLPVQASRNPCIAGPNAHNSFQSTEPAQNSLSLKKSSPVTTQSEQLFQTTAPIIVLYTSFRRSALCIAAKPFSFPDGLLEPALSLPAASSLAVPSARHVNPLRSTARQNIGQRYRYLRLYTALATTKTNFCEPCRCAFFRRQRVSSQTCSPTALPPVSR
jgi:hypothetical protein